MEKLFELRVDNGEYLKDAVSVISKLADKVVVLINKEALSILVRQPENKDGKLISILRLRGAGCSYYRYRYQASPYVDLGISLASFKDTLKNVTAQYSVSLSLDGFHSTAMEVDVNNTVTGEHQNLSFPLIPFNAQQYPFNAPIMNVDETAFKLTASIPSDGFCQILTRLRYLPGRYGFKDNCAPVHITIIHKTSINFLSPGSRQSITIKEEKREYTIEGAENNEVYKLSFDLVPLNAFMEAAKLSDRVIIHAQDDCEDWPFLSCPYGGNLGYLFFIGKGTYHVSNNNNNNNKYSFL